MKERNLGALCGSDNLLLSASCPRLEDYGGSWDIGNGQM